MALLHRPMIFSRQEAGEILEFMREAASVEDASRWVNVAPAVDIDLMPKENRFAGLFAARGPLIPMATWVPGEKKGNDRRPTSVGLEHGIGRDAIAELAELGVTTPPGWYLEQEHPRRGITFQVPSDEDPRVALDYFFAANAALCPIDFGDRWSAVTFTRVKK